MPRHDGNGSKVSFEIQQSRSAVLRWSASQPAAELWITCPVSISKWKTAVLSNCVHGTDRSPIPGSGGFEFLAFGRYAIQQILPGLGERSDPFFEELGRHGVCVNSGLGEFCQFLAWV